VEYEILNQPAEGVDLEFFCLELVNTASIRSFLARDFTVMILSQAEDSELESANEIFSWMRGSLDCEIFAEEDLEFDDDSGLFGDLKRLQ